MLLPATVDLYFIWQVNMFISYISALKQHIISFLGVSSPQTWVVKEQVWSTAKWLLCNSRDGAVFALKLDTRFFISNSTDIYIQLWALAVAPERPKRTVECRCLCFLRLLVLIICLRASPSPRAPLISGRRLAFVFDDEFIHFIQFFTRSCSRLFDG